MNIDIPISRFVPTNTYYVEVDLIGNQTKVTKTGLELYMPDDAGDIYQSKPFHGTLVAAPAKSTIPLGSVVYMNYQAYDTLTKIDNKDYYIIEEDMIICYGDVDNPTAYKSVIVDVKQVEKSKLRLDVSEDELVDAVINGKRVKEEGTTKGKVIAVDAAWAKERGVELSAGDEIEYEPNLDWEFFFNRDKHYYIQMIDQIIKVNGNLVNDYNELTPRPKEVVKNGLIVPNTDRFWNCVEGKFKGTRVLPNEKRVALRRYVKNEFIFGHQD